MSVNPQKMASTPWLVQHDVIWPYELSRRRHVDSYPENISLVHGIWIGVLDAKGSDSCAATVEVLLIVC